MSQSVVVAASVAALLGLCAGSVYVVGATAQPPKDAPKDAAKETPAMPNQPGKQPAAPDPGEAMKMMAQMSQPDDNHKLIADALAGTWDGEQTIFFGPGVPPAESKGVMVTTAKLGGRWLLHEWTGQFMGQPFQGLGTTGYDRGKKKFIGSWTDTWNTGVGAMEGTYDAASKTFTMVGDLPMPSPTGQRMPAKQVLKIVSADEHLMEIISTQGGQETTITKIRYTRKK